MITIIFMMPDFGGTVVFWIEQVLIYASLILTVVSLVDYMIKNKNVLLNGGKI